MINNLRKYQKAKREEYKFSILIPTWNNLDYLKLCIESIRQNSRFDIQIIVIVNEGKDGTLAWLENQNDIDFIHSKTNIGICYGLNIARSLIKGEYVIYLNDDMYVLPNWDLELHTEIEKIGHNRFMLSATMIEPFNTGNPCVGVKDFGTDIHNFQKKSLLNEYQGLARDDWSGSTWPPNVVHIDMWDLVGGLSIEFSPGMYSDPDFSMKLWEAGVRIFKGKGTSLVYHFGSKSTKRVRKNKGRKQFLMKWGITPRTFMQEYLRIGQEWKGVLTIPKIGWGTHFLNKLKRF